MKAEIVRLVHTGSAAINKTMLRLLENRVSKELILFAKKSYRPGDLILSQTVRRRRYRTFNRISQD